MLITQCPLPHISKLNRSFGAGVHKPVATGRVEFGGRDNLCKLLHVRGFDINDIKALVLNVEIPQIDSEVITADEGLPVAVHRNTVYMVRMSIGVRPSRHSCDNRIMVRHSWKLQHGGILKR